MAEPIVRVLILAQSDVGNGSISLGCNHLIRDFATTMRNKTHANPVPPVQLHQCELSDRMGAWDREGC